MLFRSRTHTHTYARLRDEHLRPLALPTCLDSVQAASKKKVTISPSKITLESRTYAYTVAEEKLVTPSRQKVVPVFPVAAPCPVVPCSHLISNNLAMMHRHHIAFGTVLSLPPSFSVLVLVKKIYFATQFTAHIGNGHVPGRS